MIELEKFDFSDIFPSEQSQFVRFDDIKDMMNQPKLSIPKKIAEMLDGVSIEAKNYVKANHFDSYSVLDDFTELREFYEADEDEIFPGFMGLKEYINNNLSICVAYLAGKSLGVELVEVEG